MSQQCQGTVSAGRRCKKTQLKMYCFQHLCQSESPPEQARLQCTGTCDDGERCKRFFSNGLKVCWEHREQDVPVSIETVVASKDAIISELSQQVDTQSEQIEVMMNRIRELEHMMYHPPTVSMVDEPTTDNEMKDSEVADDDGDVDPSLIAEVVADVVRKVSKKRGKKGASKA